MVRLDYELNLGDRREARSITLGARSMTHALAEVSNVLAKYPANLHRLILTEQEVQEGQWVTVRRLLRYERDGL
jgi:hypothetical protein